MPLSRHRFDFMAIAISCCMAAYGQEIIAQADPWCPFNCEPGSAKPGYAIEMLMAVFQPLGITIRYEAVPWERALMQVAKGKAGAAVGATTQHAFDNHLLIGKEPIGITSDCLFVAKANLLSYHSASDLNALKRVGIVAGYSYDGGFGEWLANKENQRWIFTERGTRPAEVNAKNLSLGRLDGVIENNAVMSHIAQLHGLAGNIRLAGCQKPTPIYVAFSPKLANATLRVQQFDAGIAALRQQQKLATILARYGQQDWQLPNPPDSAAP